MTKWTKIEDYMDALRMRMEVERKMMAEIAGRNCMHPNCVVEEGGACLFGCPFESDKRK